VTHEKAAVGCCSLPSRGCDSASDWNHFGSGLLPRRISGCRSTSQRNGCAWGRSAGFNRDGPGRHQHDDSTGRYRLENIPPGRYYVVAGLVDLPTYYPGVSSANGATALNVLSGTPITGINFTMAVSAGVTVSGRVVQPNGSPAPEVRSVGLIGGSGGPTPTSAVRTDGTFELLRVRPGNYQLLVSGAQLGPQPTPVVVADKDVTGIEVLIPPSITVTGSVNVEGNGLRPRLTIVFSPFKGNGNTQVPSAIPQPNNGSFRAILPEGDYRIGWTNLPAGYELKSITAGSIDLLSATLKVSTSAPPPPIVVNLGVGEKPPWVKVGGKVTRFPLSPPSR
jgi:hypothetical protein